MEKVQQMVDQLYKKHFGKMVTALLCFSRDIDLETAEDIVQDSFSAALVEWRGFIPANPAGWIYRVCKNKALNRIKKNDLIRSFAQHGDFRELEELPQDSFFDDHQLKLLFVCAHPNLSPKVQVIITLKYVANLKVESIARVFGMTVDGVDKLLQRARQKIRFENILLQEPGRAALQQRVPVVHKIIYLIFNEGYKASWGKEILREELCEEALLINKALLESNIGNKETMALHALMLFNAARFKARLGTAGELLDLEEHDRNLWNKDMIRLGVRYLQKSRSEASSAFHYEASIAYLHCMAENFKATNWQAISDLYQKLLQLNGNPFVELNYAIALYYAGHKNTSMEILRDLERNPFLNHYYLLNAALGKIYFMEGDYLLSEKYFRKTLGQTPFQLEKDYILRMMGRIGADERKDGKFT